MDQRWKLAAVARACLLHIETEPSAPRTATRFQHYDDTPIQGRNRRPPGFPVPTPSVSPISSMQDDYSDWRLLPSKEHLR